MKELFFMVEWIHYFDNLYLNLEYGGGVLENDMPYLIIIIMREI